MKNSLLLLFALLLSFVTHLTVIAQPPTDLTLLDDFADGNYTVNPEWTIIEGSGPWDIFTISSQRPNTLRTNMASGGNPNGFSAISTPFTKVCDVWQIDFLPATCPSSSEGRKVEYYFLMTSASNDPRLASGYKLSYHLQVLDGSTRRNFLYLQKVDNGVAANPPIAFFNNGTTCGLDRVTVTWDNGNWNLFVGNTLRSSGTDNTYNPSEAAYQSISVVDSILTTFGDTYRFDNIRYREAATTSLRGGNDELLNISLKAYPNPATDVLQINIASKRAERGELRLVDLQGRMLYSKSIALSPGDNLYDLNLRQRGIQNGTYILLLNTGAEEQKLKVVVQ